MASTMLLCAGCAGEPVDGRLAVEAEPAWTATGLAVNAGLVFDPTPPMREALARGVDLGLTVSTRVSRRYGPVAVQRTRRDYPVRIRFLPLTEQWQVTIGEDRQNFPRLWLLLDALEQPRRFATGLTREQADDGDWQVQVRAVFDRGALPSPMHLPSLLSAQWRLSSPWLSWRIDGS